MIITLRSAWNRAVDALAAAMEFAAWCWRAESYDTEDPYES